MSLGEKLRQAREAHDLTPRQVAEATHMMVQLVEEIEREDFHRIAAVIYGKGFIRLFAEQVGLDPEPLIREYLELNADSGREPKGRFVPDGIPLAPRSEPPPRESGEMESPAPSPHPLSPAPPADFPVEEQESAPLPEDDAGNADDSEPDLFSLARHRAPAPVPGETSPPRREHSPRRPPAPLRETKPLPKGPELKRGLEQAKRWLRHWGRHARRRVERGSAAITERLNTPDPAVRRILAISLAGVFVLIVVVMLGRALFHRGESPDGAPSKRPLARERVMPPPQPYID